MLYLKREVILVAMTLDEIYELFIWDELYTDEEYEARCAKGINEAKKYKYIYPFIQPVIPEKSKWIWEPCAKVVASKTDEELVPYLFLLLEWLKDINWPGAQIIFDRLTEIPFSILEGNYNLCKRQAEHENDTMWLMALKAFEKQVRG